MQKLAFITGASSGIGQALAWRFHQAGYRLALVARRTAEMDAWIGHQKIDRAHCKIYSADVSVTDSIVAAANACIAAQGMPDVVVANAGISVGVDTAEREDIDAIAQTFATNNIGMAATFHPFEGHGGARLRRVGGHWQRGRHSRTARPRRLLRQQGRCHRLLRKPAR